MLREIWEIELEDYMAYICDRCGNEAYYIEGTCSFQDNGEDVPSNIYGYFCDNCNSIVSVNGLGKLLTIVIDEE